MYTYKRIGAVVVLALVLVLVSSSIAEAQSYIYLPQISLVAGETDGAVRAAKDPSPPNTKAISQVRSIEFLVFVPCAMGGQGEFVWVTGNLHEVLQGFVVVESKNSWLHLKRNANPQGVTGVGLTSGDIYQANGSTLQRWHVRNFDPNTPPPPPDPANSFISNFLFVAPGTGNNFRLYIREHFVVDANLNVRVDTEDFWAVCK